ncbi:hypothetical protein [Bacillus sp. B15-48]|uniref:hypothetical protein n=1 Tax=Bacillus sp. B15-48 TaxID=1548601 RepID=UPI00193F95D1|nr:hypothetical protein [Bacillus sp. B15-48]MBM4762727.1 hypothetical protein [Bacillus sp. B15-48]
MHGKITTWQMTEEERLAYIKKHPIRPTKHRRSSSIDLIDYQWRGKKANESRYKQK